MLLSKLPRPFGYVNSLLLPYPRTVRDQIARTILAQCVCLSSSVLAGRVELPSPLYQNGVITVILCKVGCLNGDRTHDLFRVEEAHYRCAMRHFFYCSMVRVFWSIIFCHDTLRPFHIGRQIHQDSSRPWPYSPL